MNIFDIPIEEIHAIGYENQIYGYPLKIKSGLGKIADEINIIKNKYKIKYIYGIDLGCGNGELIDYFNKTINNSYWIGVELSNYRIHISNYKNTNVIIEGNMLDLCYTDYNFLYINNLCFDDMLCEKLENKIVIEFSGHIITTKKFECQKLLKNISLIHTFPADTNWQKGYIFYLYYL
jgi:hypothetical protein